MEHIGDILKRTQIPINTSKVNTDTSSSVEEWSKQNRPACSICHDTGYVHPVTTDGKTDYSRVVPCRCTREKREREQYQRLQQYSNLGSLVNLTFDKLIPEGRSGNPENQQRFKAAYEAARKFADEPQGWLILSGPAGSGKTHLAAAITNQRIKQGLPALFITVPDLLDHLRSAFNPSSTMSYDELFERVRNTPLLVLDDFGLHQGTPWAREKLDQLLNHRFNHELATVITTPTPFHELDPAVQARFSDERLCQFYVIEQKFELTSEYEWPEEFKLQREMTFQNFDWRRANLPEEQRENLEKAFRLAMDFARDPDGWLVFNGVTGCGKTHLAAAIVNYRYQSRKPALFVVVPDFLDYLRSAFNPESKVSYDQVFEKIKKAALLVLDDFGEQSTTPWAREKLYQLINYRYNARLPMVVTTRLSMDEILDQMESSIGSRLADRKISMIWNITAPDYRTDATATPRRSNKRTVTRKYP